MLFKESVVLNFVRLFSQKCCHFSVKFLYRDSELSNMTPCRCLSCYRRFEKKVMPLFSRIMQSQENDLRLFDPRICGHYTRISSKRRHNIFNDTVSYPSHTAMESIHFLLISIWLSHYSSTFSGYILIPDGSSLVSEALFSSFLFLKIQLPFAFYNLIFASVLPSS